MPRDGKIAVAIIMAVFGALFGLVCLGARADGKAKRKIWVAKEKIRIAVLKDARPVGTMVRVRLDNRKAQVLAVRYAHGKDLRYACRIVKSEAELSGPTAVAAAGGSGIISGGGAYADLGTSPYITVEFWDYELKEETNTND